MNTPLEIWGGIEATRNRVGNTYFDQIKRSGHDKRIEDLEAFATMGLKILRYPFLWEKIEVLPDTSYFWDWSDERIARLRELEIELIVGFMHHGSGPSHTNLLDEELPEKLARFAFRFASRFPQLTRYTPINEPLTTARFSCLYALWYPHHKSNVSFLRSLILQLRATSLAMKEIRRVQPKAELIQTEDLGKVMSSARLDYQAQFENERRWLTFDILSGRLDKKHSLWPYLIENGILEKDLHWFLENPCPPQILGINHYLTSNRFLDDQLEKYPSHLHGGNGKDLYADVEAVRIGGENFFGLDRLLEEVWNRYRLPIAITEVHLGCTREEQLRWIAEIWNIAKTLRDQSFVDIRAVTAWALLGSFDWNLMCVKESNHYEVGALDLRSSPPRKTVISQFIRSVADQKTFHHPVLDEQGWWHRPSRVVYGDPIEISQWNSDLGIKRKLLITGGGGSLATAFAKVCDVRGLAYSVLGPEHFDICDLKSIQAILDLCSPWAVINTAGFARVDEAEKFPAQCFLENSVGPSLLAEECKARKIGFVTYSSDMVFDGHQTEPYLESSAVGPLNVYGRTKAKAETETLRICPHALVIRTSAFFGPWDSTNFVTQTLNQLSQNSEVLAANDITISPTYLPDLVNASLDLLIDGERGIWHLANQGSLSWHEFASAAASKAQLALKNLRSVSADQMGYSADRPRYSVLGSEHAHLMPDLNSALNRYFHEAHWEFLARSNRHV